MVLIDHYFQSETSGGFSRNLQNNIEGASRPANMSGEAVLKPDKDFSTEVDKQLPEAQELAKVEKYSLNLDGGC